MNDRVQAGRSRVRAWRWGLWALFALGWTAALLIPDPVGLVFGAKRTAAGVGPDLEFYAAKLLHVSAYALAAVLTAWLRAPTPRRWLLLGFWSLHACGTEIAQRFVPTRSGSLRDVVLDHVGLLIGVALTWRWWRSAVGGGAEGAG